MEVSRETQELSIRSLESTLHKLSHAEKNMTEKGFHTTLVKKRKNAIGIGLESLKNEWGRGDFLFNEEEILSAIEILQGLIPPIKTQLAKAKEGSSQKTLNERRLVALQLANESLENRLS